MFQRRKIQQEVLVCPDCGGQLSPERDLLLCDEHGVFFIYGQQLLVRASGPASKPGAPPMPWENGRKRLS